MFRYVVPGLLLLLFAGGCEGPMGPPGPQGEAGPQGDTGPQGRAGRPHHFAATVNSAGIAQVVLPAEAGTLAAPPGLICYLQEPGSSVWLLVALDLEGLACGLVLSGGSLLAVIVDAPPGWSALFAAIY